MTKFPMWELMQVSILDLMDCRVKTLMPSKIKKIVSGFNP